MKWMMFCMLKNWKTLSLLRWSRISKMLGVSLMDSRVTSLLEYCSVNEVCKRLGSVSTDDAKVLEKKL